MSDDYRSGVVFASLAAVKKAIDSLGATPPRRFAWSWAPSS